VGGAGIKTGWIVLARGEANRPATGVELGVLARWEELGGPSLARCFLDEPPDFGCQE
jgi:hypothetical protein